MSATTNTVKHTPDTREWQDISTAPKDETVIACQVPTEKNTAFSAPVVIPMYVGDDGAFCDVGTWKPDVGITSGNWRVSHWMPLPPAPQEKGGE